MAHDGATLVYLGTPRWQLLSVAMTLSRLEMRVVAALTLYAVLLPRDKLWNAAKLLPSSSGTKPS